MTPIAKKKTSEHTDQVKLVMHLRTFYPEALVAAVPNGAAVSPRQRMCLVAEGLLAGFPDLMVLEPRGPCRGLMVEIKSTAATATVSAAQKRIHGALKARGYAVEVCYGYEHGKEAVMQYLLSGPNVVQD